MASRSLKLRSFAPRIVPSKAPHSATAIFHHGFGDFASSWESALSNLGPRLEHVKWVIPQAPLRSLKLQGGAPGTAWFDILRSNHAERTQDGTEDEAGMAESLADLSALIRAEREAGIPSERIVLGGFSQGAALAMLAGLTGEDRVGGVASLSGYLPLQWKVLVMKQSWANDVPFFVGHGTVDPVISFSTGKGAADKLRESGVKQVEFHSYEGMQHSSCDQEMRDLAAWLEKTVPPL
ncbi:Phospholipase/carboxylesterase/thioesterase [Leucosporidium creatinivorum]|uniref:Acyl-protein thioesterase 1 n=1 Tax=Leucosporidium creatinivorum TaxID=106004 RepID=A0A1Y2FZR7_9BASI|nr:Phospholipase/carboxylesterase/thioesterase [Leucosporidium creatinivorum]